ncbi:hypothetical protein IMY05_004G0045300 [Salix suchowensis]|nr:hypothetical protein IMY05_004G0045300 [Salix suchowensis]
MIELVTRSTQQICVDFLSAEHSRYGLGLIYEDHFVVKHTHASRSDRESCVRITRAITFYLYDVFSLAIMDLVIG